MLFRSCGFTMSMSINCTHTHITRSHALLPVYYYTQNQNHFSTLLCVNMHICSYKYLTLFIYKYSTQLYSTATTPFSSQPDPLATGRCTSRCSRPIISFPTKAQHPSQPSPSPPSPSGRCQLSRVMIDCCITPSRKRLL